MDFFSLLLLVIIGVIFLVGLIWWVASRQRNKKYDRNHSGYVVYRDDPPVIKRRSSETYRQANNAQSPQINIIGELKSLHARLSSLENRMAHMEYGVGMSHDDAYSPVLGAKRFEEPIYPVTNKEPFGEYTRPITHADFLDVATDAYRRLSLDGLRNLALEPVFVYLDVDESARGAAIGESQRVFKQSENKQNAFVVFVKNESEGWLFPNPRISYTESMGYVFPQLTFENFTDSKQSVDPMKVTRTGESTWETFTA